MIINVKIFVVPFKKYKFTHGATTLMNDHFINILRILIHFQIFTPIKTMKFRESPQQSYFLQSLVKKEKLIAFLKDTSKFITRLSLNFINLGDQGIDLIIQAQLLFITELLLRTNNITHKGIRSLRKCKWTNLKFIDLSGNKINNAGVKELIKNKWKSLEVLSLVSIGLTDDGGKTLTKGQWPKLQQIYLFGNHLTAQVFNHLIISDWILFIKDIYERGSYCHNLIGYSQTLKLYKVRKVQLQKQRTNNFIAEGKDRQVQRGDC